LASKKVTAGMVVFGIKESNGFTLGIKESNGFQGRADCKSKQRRLDIKQF
jgi:hypothetical protein